MSAADVEGGGGAVSKWVSAKIGASKFIKFQEARIPLGTAFWGYQGGNSHWQATPSAIRQTQRLVLGIVQMQPQ